MKPNETDNRRKVILSTLWIFYLCNILYADVLSLLGNVSTGSSKELDTELLETLIAPEMLLAAAILLETAMVMIVLSRILKNGINRWANIVVGVLQIFALCTSLTVGSPTIYYIFFVTVEIATLLFIVWYAWTWPVSKVVTQAD